MDKKYITTIVLEHVIDDDKKNTIFADITKRLLPEGKLPITVDSITVQDAPANMQPEYYKLLLSLGDQYQAQQQAYQQEQQEAIQQPSLAQQREANIQEEQAEMEAEQE